MVSPLNPKFKLWELTDKGAAKNDKHELRLKKALEYLYGHQQELDSLMGTPLVNQLISRMEATKILPEDQELQKQMAAIRDHIIQFNEKPITIMVLDQQVKVPKVILEYRAPTLKTVSESSFTEKDRGIIELKEIPAEVATPFLEYLKTGHCEISVETLLPLIQLADMYECEPLLRIVTTWCKEIDLKWMPLRTFVDIQQFLANFDNFSIIIIREVLLDNKMTIGEGTMHSFMQLNYLGLMALNEEELEILGFDIPKLLEDLDQYLILDDYNFNRLVDIAEKNNRRDIIDACCKWIERELPRFEYIPIMIEHAKNKKIQPLLKAFDRALNLWHMSEENQYKLRSLARTNNQLFQKLGYTQAMIDEKNYLLTSWWDNNLEWNLSALALGTRFSAYAVGLKILDQIAPFDIPEYPIERSIKFLTMATERGGLREIGLEYVYLGLGDAYCVLLKNQPTQQNALQAQYYYTEALARMEGNVKAEKPISEKIQALLDAIEKNAFDDEALQVRLVSL